MKAVVSMACLGKKTVCAAAVAGFALSFGPANAGDYTFKADYAAYLAGIPIGKATLTGTFNGPKYRIDGYGKVTGLVGVVYDYTASASSAGEFQSGKATPRAFSVNASDGEETATVRMTMNQSGVRRLKLSPAPTKAWYNHPSRVKVTDAHTKNIVDPMSALIVSGGNTPTGLDKRACERTVPIFNGRERFDVKLEFRKFETVSDKNIPGNQLLVCGAHYRAVAGHRSDKDEVKMAEKTDIELKLAPVAGSDFLLPYRVTIPTPLGQAVIQAGAMTSTGVMGKRSAALND